MNNLFDARVAVLETRLNDIDVELKSVRRRVHTLETDRATLTLIGDQLQRVTQQVKDLASASDQLAKRAAKEAVDVLMEHRDEIAARRSGVSVGWITAAVVIATFLSNVVTHLWK